MASPNGEAPCAEIIFAKQQAQHKKKILLTVALRLAIISSSPCRISRFLKHYGNQPVHFYHSTFAVTKKDSSEYVPWTGHHAAFLHAIDTDKLSLIDEVLLNKVQWPQKSVATNDPFLFALWNAVQSIDHINHPNLYFTLYFNIMDCLSVDTEDVLHLESVLARTLSSIERLKMYASYLLSDELLMTLERIFDDAYLYQQHLAIIANTEGEQTATIVPWCYKPINDLLTQVIDAYQAFHGRYQRITRKEQIGTDTSLAAHYLQCAETELRSMQHAIRGKDNGILNAICCTINPHRDHLSSQSIFANSSSSAMSSCEETLIESTQGLAKRQKTS